jgi:hypothetical protein
MPVDTRSDHVAGRNGRMEAGRRAAQPPLPAAVIGHVVSASAASIPLVDFPGNASPRPIPARSLIELREPHEGREVALAFEGGDPSKPIVLGFLQHPATAPAPAPGLPAAEENPVRAEVDGERVILTAEREIVLRCGKASITLTRAGKILLRGAYLSSRSSGVNRIKGGSVQIN